MAIAKDVRQHVQKRHRKGFLAYLLCGTILASTGIGRAETVTAEEAPSPQITEQQLDELTLAQIRISGGRYTWQQARIRAENIASGQHQYPKRADQETLRKLFSSAVQSDYPKGKVPRKAKPLWDDLMNLTNSDTITGPELMKTAAKADIFYTYEAMSKTRGLWGSDKGLVRITSAKGTSVAERRATVIHETVHGVQTAQNTIQENESWSIAEIQAATMSIESAAQTAEYVAALEFDEDGDNRLMDFELSDMYPSATAATAVAYEKARQENTPYAQALMAAGEAGFLAQFQEQSWLDFYNNRVLQRYIYLMDGKWIDPISGETYGIETVRRTGWISPTFNFTASIQALPPYDARFGNNALMRQAFDYAELERIAATADTGRDDPAYQAELTRLTFEQNPYLGVDMTKVAAVLNDSKNTLDALEVMNCHAGLTCPRKTFKIPAKIDMQACDGP